MNSWLVNALGRAERRLRSVRLMAHGAEFHDKETRSMAQPVALGEEEKTSPANIVCMRAWCA